MQTLIVFFLAGRFGLNGESRPRYHWFDHSRYEVRVAAKELSLLSPEEKSGFLTSR